jgi:amino acid permease
MTIAFPTSGNFIDYADRFVDPALAFGAGFAEWLGNGSHFYVSTQKLISDRLDCRGGF